MPDHSDVWKALTDATESLDAALSDLVDAAAPPPKSEPQLRAHLERIRTASETGRRACESAKSSLAARTSLDTLVETANKRAEQAETTAQATASSKATEAAKKEGREAAAAARDFREDLVRARTHVSLGVLYTLGSALLSVDAADQSAERAIRELADKERAPLTAAREKTTATSTAVRGLVDDRLNLERSLYKLLLVSAREEENRQWYPVDPEMAKVRAAGIAPRELTPEAKEAPKPVKPEDQSYEVLVKQLLARIAKK
ncbi:hypothetical protein GCM10017608_16050 [Agromyces luteolus]|uniref:Uncharacterized protein n=1 Tax=Agromyces luteolus TaxID=88373 RepID=A0A7C9LDD3_9MICO|nr:hypothetical protein [Agromyces luteolus]MUN06911.1 hypothetical protein [Agromyces luteolus]GLK27671.1 hypothetical protein GCM10017608_16050 [Agromyces luteolus]